ncbi:hypothetical protein PAPYR_3765 [Paratrimastix pyriformis]|uniref:Transmembrane protein n=1 Tax=Paratrimastix pyriformis TaxID=342808 RepID=A0ABQ8ULH5_9EUKA|nr:hypothetical protein PAPYR_3765 [Paratrimastix pyriformis]
MPDARERKKTDARRHLRAIQGLDNAREALFANIDLLPHIFSFAHPTELLGSFRTCRLFYRTLMLDSRVSSLIRANKQREWLARFRRHVLKWERFYLYPILLPLWLTGVASLPFILLSSGNLTFTLPCLTLPLGPLILLSVALRWQATATWRWKKLFAWSSFFWSVAMSVCIWALWFGPHSAVSPAYQSWTRGRVSWASPEDFNWCRLLSMKGLKFCVPDSLVYDLGRETKSCPVWMQCVRLRRGWWDAAPFINSELIATSDARWPMGLFRQALWWMLIANLLFCAVLEGVVIFHNRAREASRVSYGEQEIMIGHSAWTLLDYANWLLLVLVHPLTCALIGFIEWANGTAAFNWVLVYEPCIFSALSLATLWSSMFRYTSALHPFLCVVDTVAILMLPILLRYWVSQSHLEGKGNFWGLLTMIDELEACVWFFFALFDAKWAVMRETYRMWWAVLSKPFEPYGWRVRRIFRAITRPLRQMFKWWDLPRFKQWRRDADAKTDRFLQRVFFGIGHGFVVGWRPIRWASQKAAPIFSRCQFAFIRNLDQALIATHRWAAPRLSEMKTRFYRWFARTRRNLLANYYRKKGIYDF